MSQNNTETTAITQAITKGAHHIGLTVPDVKQTRDFFISALGFKQVGEKPDYPAIFVSDGNLILTLWQADVPSEANTFDRKNNIGLHHLALQIKNSTTLEQLHERLVKTDDVEIEFSPELRGGGPTKHMMCNIPGGIRIEFIAAY
jgi:catechol 2,3-dioxygenase-like lactoylglutathione lyase family enzyme